MSTSISKGRMFRVTTVVDDARLKQFAKAPEVLQETLQATAAAWHEGMLPRHFEPNAHFRYGYAARGKKYREKKGGLPDLVKRGSLKNDVTRQVQLRVQSRNVVEAKMQSRTLNLIPRLPENSDDPYVKLRTTGKGRGFPNLKRELKVINEDEREQLAQVAAAEAERAFGPTDEKTTAPVTGLVRGT